MTTLETVLNWRPRTPFFYGWLLIGMAALTALVGVTLGGLVMGGIQGFILEDTGWNRSTIGFAVTAGVWLSGLVAPFVGRLADRYGPRWLMSFGLIVMGISLFSMAGVSSIWQFYLVIILGRSMTHPLLIGVVPRTAAVNFFQRQRAIALSLTGMARPISGGVNIQVTSAISAAYGWRTAFRIIGTASLLLTLPILIVMRRRPEDIGLLPDGTKADGATLAASQESQPGSSSLEAGRTTPAGGGTPEFSWTAGEALRTRAFWLVALAALMAVMASSGMAFNIVPYLQEQADLSRAQAAGVLSLSTFLALSHLGWAYLANKLTPRVCMMAAMVFAAGMVLFLLTVSSAFSAYVFGVLWGISSGSSEALIYILLARYFGRASYGTLVGTLRPFEAAGLGVGHSLGPVIYDLTKSYKGLLAALTVFHLLAALSVFFVRPPALPQRTSAQTDLE